MAKVSSRSKGYRKYPEKKKGFATKKEWIIMGVTAAVVIIAFVLLVTINFDGALEVKNGVAQVTGENALVVNGSRTSAARYFQLGNIRVPAGWTMQKQTLMDVNTPSYVFTPMVEGDIDSINVSTSVAPAKEMADSVPAYYTMYAENFTSLKFDEAVTINSNGLDVTYIFTRYSAETTVAAEAAAEEATEETEETVKVFAVELSAFADAGDGRCVCIYVTAKDDNSAEALPADEALLSCLNAVTASITLQ